MRQLAAKRRSQHRAKAPAFARLGARRRRYIECVAAVNPRRTKIVATIGPACSSPEMVRSLVEAGMDAARLNLSHGTHADHEQRAQLVRDAQVAAGRVRCGIIVGGSVTSHKGVNLPGVPIPIPSLTRKDLEDLEFALQLGCDYIALSFVRSAADVRDLKALIEQEGSTAHVIAKIEKAEAVDALGDILAETDAVMVARGDLGVEIGPELVPLVQKRIIQSTLERGKPVITATQMLESMIHHPEPTRAEASDVATAILDGTSAIMLSGETAMGEYPVQAVQTMDRIARAVEPSLGYRHQIPEATDDPTIGNAMSNAACDLAEALGASALLVPTFTGRTASAVARLRPRRPIVALTHKRWSVHQMAIEWGVTPIWIPEAKNVEDLWTRSIDAAKAAGLVETGDTIVITAGTAVNIPGSTNVIKVDVA